MGIPIFLIFDPKHRLYIKSIIFFSTETFNFYSRKNLFIAWTSFRNENILAGFLPRCHWTSCPLCAELLLFNQFFSISPLCLVLVRDPHWLHVRKAKFCLWVTLPGVFFFCFFFSRGSPVFAHLLISPSHMS